MVLSLIAKIKNCAKNTFHLDQLWHGLLKRGETPELKSAVLHTSAQCHGSHSESGGEKEERKTVLQLACRYRISPRCRRLENKIFRIERKSRGGGR